MNNKEVNFIQFQRTFKENKAVKKYFLERNLSKKLYEENLIGFCPVYSNYSFPLLRGRLIIPIKNVYGEVIALAGRQIPELKDSVIQSFWDSFGTEPAKCQDRINKWSKGKWINEPYQKTRNLFFLDHTKNNVLKKNYIVLTEGYFDAYNLYCNGIDNVAAICGTSISDYQIALALRYCDNIVLLMDSDDPGINATKTIADKIEEIGANVFKIFLPVGMDPDDFLKEYDISFLDDKIKDMIESNKKSLYIRV